MRWRPFTCLWLIVLFPALLFCCLHPHFSSKSSTQHPASQNTRPTDPSTINYQLSTLAARPPTADTRPPTLDPRPPPPSLNSQLSTLNSPRFPLRNTPKSPAQLARSDKAILLENVLLDTDQPIALPIPDSLRAQGDPGTYIVQARAPLDDAFRALLREVRATIISYIPNNAYLVRANAATAQELSARAQVQAVLPYEPYYKLNHAQLELAVEQRPLPDNTTLNLLLFPDARDSTLAELSRLRVQVLSEEPSPFGPVLKVGPRAGPGVPPAGPPGVSPDGMNVSLAEEPIASMSDEGGTRNRQYAIRNTQHATPNTPTSLNSQISTINYLPRPAPLPSPLSLLPSLALLRGVQCIELSRPRLPANDLSRARLHVATDTVAPDNYLGLTGTNILIAVNDSGVDTNHPDLSARVMVNVPISGVDSNGHGTHVAGIIAGSGSQSLTVTNAQGSIMPPVNLQFRGQAPAAKIYSVALNSGPASSDSYLQETAANAEALISNNSWNYAGSTGYDLAAASYDAAVRDALPTVPGPQPLLFVFSAGDAGAGDNEGGGGARGSIQSPATAKNVITVGALEQPRHITNDVWKCTPGCVTNQPWLALTDSSNQVAGLSSRGNVGVGIEGDFGRLKPDVVAPGVFVISARSTQWDQRAYYSNLAGSNGLGNYIEVLSNLNNSLGPFYRYESGSSMSAAAVSGVLALMEEFFEQRLGRTNSPALMKALLINGARSVPGYALAPSSLTNFQGWGLVNLTNSLPAALTNHDASPAPMFLLDQNPATALATGQQHTRYLSVATAAQTQPLRVTLVWTDPPGNPVAAAKLVNDLDLIVTNLDTGQVFFGNHFSATNAFSLPWDTNNPPNPDTVNNVENTYLWASPAAPLAENYSITVAARRVPVNAGTAQTNGVVQDYALVISSGDGQIPDSLFLGDSPVVSATRPLVTIVTNEFSSLNGVSGALLLNQRAGASAPLVCTNTIPLPAVGGQITIGQTNQWHFYVFTNDTAFTNAVFLTFLPHALALPPTGVTNLNDLAPSTLDFRLSTLDPVLPESDIDLYVSQAAGLTNLDPVVIAAADKSLTRGGAETIAYSNATPGLYYVGVKSESQAGAEYGLLFLFTELPFSTSDTNGNQTLRGFPVPAPIPDATSALPGAAYVFAVSSQPITVHRAIVTNTITHEATSNLFGYLDHNHDWAVLNNHSAIGAVTNRPFIYDDSSQHDVPNWQPTDSPGSLRNFAGREGAGQWRLTMLDTVPGHVGTNGNLGISLERQPDLLAGVTNTILPGACSEDFLYVPPQATNLTVSAAVLSGAGSLLIALCPTNLNPADCPTIVVSGPGTNSITIDNLSNPAIKPGLYILRLCNQGLGVLNVQATYTLGLGDEPLPLKFLASGPTPIPDDAVSISTIHVPANLPIVSVEAGVRIVHPRVSDLVLHLISPNGTRVLLAENRGGATTDGMGTDAFQTNTVAVSSSGGAAASTNIIDTGQTSGTITIAYDFYALPDDLRVYYTNALIFDSGLIAGSGTNTITFGPGASTLVTIVMNEGGNTDTNTAWDYRVTSTFANYRYATFTENTGETLLPIKFAPPPFTNATYAGTNPALANGIFYLPEDSRGLNQFIGQTAGGDWRLEIADTRAGATNPAPTLRSWDLSFVVAPSAPPPTPLGQGVTLTDTVGAGQLLYFAVDVPAWAGFATNWLQSASAPVSLLFNQLGPPSRTNGPGDFMLLAATTGGSATLRTNGVPPLTPGARYYLGVLNANAAAVTFGLEVDFDVNVITLRNGVPYANTNAGPGAAADYYRYLVTTNALRAQFEIAGPGADLTLVARKGLPLPSLASYDLISANPGMNDELITLFNFSGPVPLTAGEWFLSVVNPSSGPAAYSILASEWPVYGTGIVITSSQVLSNSFCLTWTSLPGVHYFVQGKTTLEYTNWTAISPTITAANVATTYCVPLPSPYHFFRVHEGLALSSYVPPVSISSITRATNGVRLEWTSSTAAGFQVQWAAGLAPPAWNTFTNIITSATGNYWFLDDGSQSGGLGDARFYRLLQFP